jgi:hypothetical protein
LITVTSVPTGSTEKSTTTSNRSPGAMSSTGWDTGAASRPPSAPICTHGRSGPPGTLSTSRNRRALATLSSRSR